MRNFDDDDCGRCRDVYSMIRYFFCRIFCPCRCGKDKREVFVRLTLRAGAFSVTFQPAKGSKFMFTLPDDKVASATVAFVDAKGNPAKVEGAPAWSSSDPAILDVVAAADGMSATVTPVGPLGGAQVKVEADADMGEGVVPVILLGDVEVVAGQAVGGAITFAIQ